MAAQFIDSENYVLSLFEEGAEFFWNGDTYTVLNSGKPVVSKGEPKTDVYVMAANNRQELEIKISFKQDNADFLENKMKPERAEQIFGSNWRQKIESFTSEIEDEFYNRHFIFKNKLGRVSAGSITLGWRFELVDKDNGDLSNALSLTRDELLEVYAGYNLDEKKRNARVNGELIENSGVANAVINCSVDDLFSVQDAVDNIVGVESYIEQNPVVHFVCKALNYQSFKNKIEGNRHLAVYIDWRVQEGRLTPQVIFNNPLETKGKDVKARLEDSLELLGIHNTDELNESNVSNVKYMYF